MVDLWAGGCSGRFGGGAHVVLKPVLVVDAVEVIFENNSQSKITFSGLVGYFFV